MTISWLHKDRKEDHIEERSVSSSHGWAHCKSYTKLAVSTNAGTILGAYFQPVLYETDITHNPTQMLNKLTAITL
jgi:hypothetical protein